MVIHKGLFDNSVLQRRGESGSFACFEGACGFDGVLKAYVSQSGKDLPGFDPAIAGEATNGSFRGCINGLPSGGPYNIKIVLESTDHRTKESLSVVNVLVGDLWILAGQSNMEGVGQLRYAVDPNPMVHAFYMDDRWDIAKDPLHVLADAVDGVHADLCGGVRPERNTVTGVGPGLSFACEMYRITGVPQGLIACAHGGTSMTQWSPALKGLGGKSLYGAMYRRFVKNGGRIAGVLWYQGCNDANPVDSPLYTERMKEFVKSVRRDFGDDRLPFAAAQLSRVCYPPTEGNCWNYIREQQRLLPESIDNFYTVPTIDLSLDDFIHISGYDQKRLGARMAGAMASLGHTTETAEIMPPIKLKEIKIETDKVTGFPNVAVSFDNVAGRLESKGRPCGFELTGKRDEITVPYVFNIELDGSRAILRAGQSRPDTENLFLYYGYGVQPYCNITDSCDRSLPAFGPVRVGKAKAFGNPATKAEVSRVFQRGGDLSGLEYPKSFDGFDFVERNWHYMQLNTHDLMAGAATPDGYVFYRLAFECTEEMDLNLFMGYDGPVKAWIDGKQVFHDHNGSCPANVDDSITPCRCAAGRHEILVALGSSSGRAAGIFLRFERLDISSVQLEKGPGYYVAPVFIQDRPI